MTASAIKARFKLGFEKFLLDVNLNLPGTGVTVLLGASGSGKTTLLRCMAGLEHPRDGYLSINGSVWQDSVSGLFLPTHQRHLGYVFQDANLFPHLNVIENLQFGLKRTKQAAPYNTAFSGAIELLGISHLLDRMPDRLSGGEKQRVAIARALVLTPDILLMDEPLASLDGKRKQEIMPYLLKLQQEYAIPVIYVTHSRQEAAQLADYLVVLENGQVQATGSLVETLSRLDLPLAQDKQAAVVWNAEITGHEPEFGLTTVSTQAGLLSLPIMDAPVGKKVRVQIHASDVSVTLQTPLQTSILNILPAIVTGITGIESSHAVALQLQIGEGRLLAHITLKSAHLLNLKIRMSVYVQIKGTSLLH